MEVYYAGIALTGPTLIEHAGPIAKPRNLLVEVGPLVGADYAAIDSYGNSSMPISFSCVRQYASLLDAMEARGTFFESLPRTGQLELRQTFGGVTLYQVAARAVKASIPPPEMMTRAIRWTFQFVVPRLIATRETIDLVRNNDGTILLNNDGTPLRNNS